MGSRAKEVHGIIDKWLQNQERELELQYRKKKEELGGRKVLLEGYVSKLVVRLLSNI